MVLSGACFAWFGSTSLTMLSASNIVSFKVLILPFSLLFFTLYHRLVGYSLLGVSYLLCWLGCTSLLASVQVGGIVCCIGSGGCIVLYFVLAVLTLSSFVVGCSLSSYVQL